MQIKATWDNDSKTVILMTFPAANWSWEDHISALQHASDMLNSTQHTVHFIVDMTKTATWIPKLPVSQFKRIQYFIKHPHIGKIVVVGSGLTMQIFIDIFRKITPTASQSYVFLDTLEDARVYLESIQNVQPELR